jgi:phage N-6-adenine-methyltransferase
MKTAIHFSSASDNWATPVAFFNSVEAEFGLFDLDPCADALNAKAKKFFTREDDGLKQPWYGRVWMNPPYGRVIGSWMRKAYESSLEGASIVVCLVPARTDTSWWHEYAMRGEVRFIRGRLKFGSSSNAAPFPSALVIFRNSTDMLQ